MAHYKRGKCRYKGMRTQASEVHYRTRLGLKPIKIPEGPSRQTGMEGYHEWRRWWQSQNFWPNGTGGMGNWPRWHDILYHNRPRRAKENQLAKGIVTGRIDGENAIWPVEKKPHSYYW